MVSPETVPVLTSDEVDALLVFARRADPSGLAPSATGWVGTWNLNAGAAEGWVRKAGKVAGSFDFGGDSQSFARSQMHTMCLEMAAQYRRGLISSVRILSESGSASGVDCSDVLMNVNDG
jgi:hypothetical protein